MKSLVLACVLLLALTDPVTAAAPDPQDFAYGCQLPAAEDGGVFSLPLPLAVYERVTQSSLGDLRVFNGAGEVAADLTVGTDISLANTNLVVGGTLNIQSIKLRP